MKRQTASIVIDRNPVEVFYFLDDVSRERDWQQKLLSAEQDPPGPSRVGTRKRYRSEFMGREIQNTYVVIEVEPGRRLVTETTPDSAVEAVSEVRVEPEGAGTRVTLTVDAAPRGFMKLMPARVLESAFEKQIDASLADLKRCIEGLG